MIANGLAGNTNCNSGFGSQFGIGSYGGFATGSSYLNGISALQQQLQTYSQIPVTQQTPDMQVPIAQLQSRINAMNPATGSAYYGLNSVNPISSTGLYSKSGR